MQNQPNLPTDDLTGFVTRKAFLEEFRNTMGRAKTHHEQVSIAFLDIDDFLNVNERFGHRAGDLVLTTIADMIKRNVSEEVIVARYGGDEFALLFPNTEREQAFLTLERIRTEVERQQIPLNENDTVISDLTVSGGLASFSVDGSSEAEILRKSDQALYRAKVTGRNKIRLAYEERMVPKTAHFTQTQLERLSELAEEQGVGEAELLREAMDDLLSKYGINDIES